MTIAQVLPGAPQTHKAGAWRSVRIFAFPLLTNVWLLLLFVSQKVFVPVGLLLTGFGDTAYRRDIVIAFLISLIGTLVYLTQYPTPYDQIHLLGFLPFVWSMPLVNHAVREDPVLLRRLLSYFTLFNAIMGVYLLVESIDLYGLRGLNRIEGKDGITYRIYFESASLAAVFSINLFKQKWMKLAALAMVAYFVLFIAKSVVVIVLFLINLAFPYFLRSKPHVKLISATIIVGAAAVIFIYLPILRPDIDLSLRVKQYQLDIIMSLLPDHWWGWGWGFYLPQLASDQEQPYQVEMQLPMLLLQLGPIVLLLVMSFVLILFMSTSELWTKALARFIIYGLIGFNNPWLFLPSWFLTCQLLFREDKTPDLRFQPRHSSP